jgi:hypothetical protein
MVGDVAVIAPDGITVKVTTKDDLDTIEVCDGKACKSLRPKQRRPGFDDVRAVTVMPDRHSLLVGQGMAPVAAEHLVRYDLRDPGARQELARCGEVRDVIAGIALVLKTDCGNRGGSLLLFDAAGQIRGSIASGNIGENDPIWKLGGDRWLFVDYGVFAVWDLAKAKQLFAVRTCR